MSSSCVLVFGRTAEDELIDLLVGMLSWDSLGLDRVVGAFNVASQSNLRGTAGMGRGGCRLAWCGGKGVTKGEG